MGSPVIRERVTCQGPPWPSQGRSRSWLALMRMKVTASGVSASPLPKGREAAGTVIQRVRLTVPDTRRSTVPSASCTAKRRGTRPGVSLPGSSWTRC